MVCRERTVERAARAVGGVNRPRLNHVARPKTDRAWQLGYGSGEVELAERQPRVRYGLRPRLKARLVTAYHQGLSVVRFCEVAAWKASRLDLPIEGLWVSSDGAA